MDLIGETSDKVNAALSSRRLEVERLNSSHRLATFEYHSASDTLLEQILSRIERCDPVAILGPRGIGKQVLLSRVRSELTIRDSPKVVLLRCESFVEAPRQFGEGVVQQLHPDKAPLEVNHAAWADVIEEELKTNAALTELYMNNNFIDVEGAVALAECLTNKKYLADTKTNLDQCP